MEQFIELGRGHADDGHFLCDEFLFEHVDGHADCGRAVAFSDAALEHEERALFDGELDVLHVAVVFFEAFLDIEEFLVDLRHGLFERDVVFVVLAPGVSLIGAGVRMPATTSSPWALMRYSP